MKSFQNLIYTLTIKKTKFYKSFHFHVPPSSNPESCIKILTDNNQWSVQDYKDLSNFISNRAKSLNLWSDCPSSISLPETTEDLSEAVAHVVNLYRYRDVTALNLEKMLDDSPFTTRSSTPPDNQLSESLVKTILADFKQELTSTMKTTLQNFEFRMLEKERALTKAKLEHLDFLLAKKPVIKAPKAVETSPKNTQIKISKRTASPSVSTTHQQANNLLTKLSSMIASNGMNSGLEIASEEEGSEAKKLRYSSGDKDENQESSASTPTMQALPSIPTPSTLPSLMNPAQMNLSKVINGPNTQTSLSTFAAVAEDSSISLSADFENVSTLS